MVGWVFFRAETLPAAIAYLRAMFGWAGAAMPALRLSLVSHPGGAAGADCRHHRLDTDHAGDSLPAG